MIKFLFLIIFGILNVQDYEDVIEYATTSWRLEQVLCQLEFISDVEDEDEFMPPARFLKRGGGDCDDFALCSAMILSIHDYDTKIYSMWRYDEDEEKWKGHAVTWFKKGRDQGYFSNDTRYRTKKTIEEYCEYSGYTGHELTYELLKVEVN